MKLYAISDLHLHHRLNWKALVELPPHQDDWLIVAGDVGETTKRFAAALKVLTTLFARVFWTPGNHDLWTVPGDPLRERGVAKYQELVAVCRFYGVVTPEDPYVSWPNGPIIAPIFTLYDYSFRPQEVTRDTAVAWAEESGIVCADEAMLHPDPYPTLPDWSLARCQETERRLAAATANHAQPLILAGHFPLREDLVHLWRIPRFSIWCGTHMTEEWHRRFPVTAVIYGHLHMRDTAYRDGVRFEEVSLGYPDQWHPSLGLEPYLRQIWPPPLAG